LFSGPDARMLISGSGNLSHNGMTRGVELDTIIEARKPTVGEEMETWDLLGRIQTWFDDLWSAATAYQGALETSYRAAFVAAPSTPAPTDDDWAPDTTPRGYTPAQLAGARRAAVFWIEAGNLTHNLGAGLPGSQLMMRGMTRVFFGIAAKVVPKKTSLGVVDIRHGSTIHEVTLEYAHNGMDRLNLPHPGQYGPAAYDQQTLVFRKSALQGRVILDLSLATTSAERKALRAASAIANLDFVMPGRNARRFGFIPA